MAAARALFGALMLGICCRPAAAANPAGVDLIIPANAPTLGEIEAATAVKVPQTSSPGAGLTPLSDNSGNPVTLQSTDGVWSEAFTDAAGNTIIDYEWTQHDSQETVAGNTLGGENPDDQPAFNDALVFAQTVIALTVSQGTIGPSGLCHGVFRRRNARILRRMARRTSRRELRILRPARLLGRGASRRDVHLVRRCRRPDRPVRHRFVRAGERGAREPADGSLRHDRDARVDHPRNAVSSQPGSPDTPCCRGRMAL